MLELLSVFSFEALFLLILSLFAILLLLVVFSVARNTTYLKKLTHPHEHTLKKVEEEAEKIMSRAIEEAHDITKKAQSEGIRRLAEEKLEVQVIEKKYEEAIEKTVHDVQKIAESYRAVLQEKLRDASVIAEEELKKGAADRPAAKPSSK